MTGIPGTADGDPSPYPGLIIEEIMDSASMIDPEDGYVSPRVSLKVNRTQF